MQVLMAEQTHYNLINSCITLICLGLNVDNLVAFDQYLLSHTRLFDKKCLHRKSNALHMPSACLQLGPLIGLRCVIVHFVKYKYIEQYSMVYIYINIHTKINILLMKVSIKIRHNIRASSYSLYFQLRVFQLAFISEFSLLCPK